MRDSMAMKISSDPVCASNSRKRFIVLTGAFRFFHSLVLFSFIFLSVQTAVAVPASPESREIEQPDGTRFHLKLRGDEFFSWTETTNGHAVVKDTDGFWKFARPVANRAAFVVIPDARVGSSDPVAHAVKKNDMPDMGVLRKHIQEQQRKARGEPVELQNPGAVSSDTAVPPTDEPPPVQPPSNIPVSGTKTIKNIVILACFSNHWDSGNSTVLSTQGRVSVNEYSNLFNQAGYTNDSAVGSVRDYYNEVSYGKLTVQSVVTPWVQLPQNETYYGNGNPDANPQQMVLDAINAAATAGFDFSQGDSDGDGWIDCLTIIHSGRGEEYSGNPTTCIWSHQWNMTSMVTKNSIKMYRYHTEPALRGWSADTPAITRIGVICHEMGHFFGLPDLYDYSSTTYGLGNWSIMAGGSWNGTYGTSPAHFDAWSKCFLGFVNPVQVHSQVGLSIARAEDNAVVKLLRDGMSTGEYFLVENRAKTGFDNASQIYPGTLIYHVDSKSANNDLGTWLHPVVKIEEADGDNSLGSKTVSSEAGDVWTSTSGLTGGFRDQTGNQSANAMLYQAVAYNRTSNTAFYSYNTLSNFSAAVATMTCDIRSLKTTLGNQTTNSSSYTVSWPACSQATQYEIQEGVKATLTNFSDGAEDEDVTYNNWYLAGTVKRDSSGKRSGSYSYAMHQYYGNWGSSVQSLTMRNPLKVTSSTVISFYLMSHLSSGYGYLKCQISNDGGNTWKTLGTYDGFIDPWSLRSYNYAAINAAGISAGDLCLLRFVANFESANGWSAFPGYGYAVDDISITGTEMSGYSNWATLSNSVPGTSYGVSGKSDGVYAYRVRTYANGVWQGYGSEGEVTADLPPTVTINQAAGQADPTNGSPVNFTVVFSESVADFATGDVTITGTAPGTKTGTVTGAGTTYNVAVSGTTGNGTVIATIAAGKATDSSGNTNTASTSTDNMVTYDVTVPGCAITRTGGSPTNAASVQFSVLFSEAVTNFAADDVVLTGTAPGKIITGFIANTASNFTVTVGNITGGGTVTIAVADGSCIDAAGNPNTAGGPTSYDIIRELAQVTLSGLSQMYDGSARVVTASTVPTGLTVSVTYDGSVVAPTNAGSYAVTGTVVDVSYQGWTNGMLTVNAAPGFIPIGVQTAIVGVVKTFTVSATGYPVPALALQVTTALSGYSFTPETGQLNYTPPQADAGSQSFTFTASNGFGVATQVVSMAVNDIPVGGGMETFDDFTNSSSSYQAGTFIGQDGSIWTYAKTRGDCPITGKTPTIRNQAAAYIRSGTISNGVANLTFNYRMPFSDTVMGTKVYVIGQNSTYTGTVTSVPSTTNEILIFTATNVNVTGNFTLLFTNTTSTARIAIDDISWTGFSAPIFNALGAQSATAGVTKVFTVGARGAPTPALALQGTTVSSGYSFTPGTGQLSYTPPQADTGTQIFTFTASNSAGVATQVVSVTVIYVADIDGDGIPNDWELQYFGGTTNANPSAIAANGINTIRQAYIIGLDPTNAQSIFSPADLRLQSNNLVFGWPSASGRVYTIYWTSNLLSTFTPMQSNYTGGVFTDTTHNANDDGFYRIEVRLAP